MRELIRLYLIFLKIGSIAFGGGLAMYPILANELIEKRGWITESELTDYYAIGQCTPGIIAINVSTFIGNKRCGTIGGIIATLGFVTVPLLLLALIAASLRRAAQIAAVRSAFAGIRVCVCVLIINAVLRLWKSSVVDIPSFLIFFAAFALCAGSRYLPIPISPALVVIAALMCGILLRRASRSHR